MDKLARKLGVAKARQQRRIKELSRTTRDRDVRQKLELFCLALRLNSVSEACARRGYSRRFYYRWWRRFTRGRSAMSLCALEPESRRPGISPGGSRKRLSAASAGTAASRKWWKFEGGLSKMGGATTPTVNVFAGSSRQGGRESPPCPRPLPVSRPKLQSSLR
jgi:hypothetical protein